MTGIVSIDFFFIAETIKTFVRACSSNPYSNGFFPLLLSTNGSHDSLPPLLFILRYKLWINLIR